MEFVALVRRPSLFAAAAATVLLAAAPRVATAQGSPPAADTTAPKVGQMAPDFALPGATRYGVLQQPVRMSDFRGQTVVLAFFFKARTKG